MLTSTPTAASETTSEDPPYERKGSGTPVTGSRPVTAPRFTSVCRPNQATIPDASRRPKTSVVRVAITIPAYRSVANASSTTISPISPSSSPRIEKMKSVCALGTYSHFCREAPRPTPVKPPDPSAIRDWIS
jgi:hypothetical protein